MKKYNTIINFVEPTMLLKRVTVDTFNNTYPLGHDYIPAYLTYADQNGEYNNGDYPLPPYAELYNPPSDMYKDIYYVGEQINLIALNAGVVWRETGASIGATKATITIKERVGDTLYTRYTINYNPAEYEQGSFMGSYPINEGGKQFEIWYDFTAYANADDPDGDSFSGTIFYGTKSIPIYAINPIEPAPRIMLDAVCERIFKGSLGKREKDAVPFKLEVATRQWFNTITAPEYCFTRSTLYEVLMEIGGTKEVNAVPRLLWNEQTNAFDTITFIKQGDSTDEYTLPSGVKLTGEEVDINADEYCEEFDSYAENMVNTLDAQRGSIIEPANFIDSPDAYYKTCRSEELVITDNTSIIECDRGIYKPISLRAAYDGKSADITPYLFEAAEYDNLTSYKGTYPYAKEFALRYAQGDNKITGLCLKAETVTELGKAFTNMAIYNILERVGLLSKDTKPGICNISFRLTYIPINTARVKQRKAYTDWKGSGTQIYNQGGNVVEADYYGNHLKYRLARIGNPIKKYTFRLQGSDRPPNIGQVFYDEEDGELLYISQIDEEIGLTYTLITMWLTRNVNRLYNYTAINSRKRQYAIDEKMSVDRHINISENIYIGDSIDERDTSITRWGINKFMIMFSYPRVRNIQGVSTAIARGVTYVGKAGENAAALGVTSLAIGNSLYFGFRYKDNYSAGNQSIELESAKRLVRAVPYGDDNGMFNLLSASLLSELPSLNQDSANSYPEVDYDPPKEADSGFTMLEFVDLSSPHGRIPVYKDSRDILHIDIQEHFIATRRSLIIGSELAYCNRLINGTSDTFGVAFLPYRLNEQRETLDIQDRYKAGDLASSKAWTNGIAKKAGIYAITNTTQIAAKSWAIYNKANNRLVIGENMDIAANGQTLPITFNF